jgi:hypothetical protein
MAPPVRRRQAPSLKGCEKANFFPYLDREVAWSMLRRRVTFEPVAAA